MWLPANHLFQYALLNVQCSMVYWSNRVSLSDQVWLMPALLVFTLDLSGLLQKFFL